VSGSLKSYFYVVCRTSTGADSLQQHLEAFSIVGDSKRIGQYNAFRTENKAVVFILCHINSNANHDDTSRVKIYDAASTEHFAL
jgi:hypothetical protein